MDMAVLAQSPERRARVDARLTALEKSLNISVRWTLDMQEFKVCPLARVGKPPHSLHQCVTQYPGIF